MTEPAPLEGVALTTAALEGLGLAASERDGRPLSTADILLGLLAADDAEGWANVQLQARYLDREEADRHPDPSPGPRGVWQGVPLTVTATASLQAAVRIAADYHLVPVPPGVLALGLLSEPTTGACRALLDGSDCTHEQLLGLVQSEILEVDLDAFEPAGAGKPRGARLAGMLSRRKALEPPASVRSHDWVAEPPGALDVLAAAVAATGTSDGLGDLLASMLLDGERIPSLVGALRGVPDVPADEVRASAERRFGESPPDAGALIVAAASSGSERVAEALRRLALTPRELAAQVAEYRLRKAGDSVSTRTIRFTVLNALFGLLASLLVIRASFGDVGHWWRIFFLWIVWTGHPQFGPLGSAVVAVVLAVLVSPLVGAVHLVGILVDTAQARSERQTILARTGIRLTLAELRRVTQRSLTSRARRMRSLRQSQQALARARRDGREDPYS